MCHKQKRWMALMGMVMQSIGGYLLSDDVQTSILSLLGYDTKSKVDAYNDVYRS